MDDAYALLACRCLLGGGEEAVEEGDVVVGDPKALMRTEEGLVAVDGCVESACQVARGAG